MNNNQNQNPDRKQRGDNFDRRTIVDTPKSSAQQIAAAKKKGFYIVLFIGICAIGIYSIISAWVTNPKSNVPQSDVAVGAKATPMPEKKSIPVNADTLPIDESEPIPDGIASSSASPNNENNNNQSPKNTLSQAPVSGKIIKDFSDSDLMYSNTMRDWRTHAGVDIAAQPDTPVTSIKDGVLKKVYEDSLFGTTVVIHHDDGTDSVYSNLKDATDEPIGTTLKMGTVIGKIGSSAASEGNDEPHLHFEIKLDETFLDPKQFVEFEEVEYIASPTPESQEASVNVTPSIIIPTDTPIDYGDDTETMIID